MSVHLSKKSHVWVGSLLFWIEMNPQLSKKTPCALQFAPAKVWFANKIGVWQMAFQWRDSFWGLIGASLSQGLCRSSGCSLTRAKLAELRPGQSYPRLSNNKSPACQWPAKPSAVLAKICKYAMLDMFTNIMKWGHLCGCKSKHGKTVKGLGLLSIGQSLLETSEELPRQAPI